ncbi:MAG: hypothetical protein HOL01_03645 [Planctomycetaceae bacterium]|jgi:hypothetical protein|nr:hypothetical protein [Planctomycetaceae bacterium]MBT6486943.1 hypothetical protein [Planctomycetaceae bacterium]MBT6493627.1 hypothetical protein [Planctomycetaceae bacterium]
MTGLFACIPRLMLFGVIVFFVDVVVAEDEQPEVDSSTTSDTTEAFTGSYGTPVTGSTFLLQRRLGETQKDVATLKQRLASATFLAAEVASNLEQIATLESSLTSLLDTTGSIGELRQELEDAIAKLSPDEPMKTADGPMKTAPNSTSVSDQLQLAILRGKLQGIESVLQNLQDSTDEALADMRYDGEKIAQLLAAREAQRAAYENFAAATNRDAWDVPSNSTFDTPSPGYGPFPHSPGSMGTAKTGAAEPTGDQSSSPLAMELLELFRRTLDAQVKGDSLNLRLNKLKQMGTRAKTRIDSRVQDVKNDLGKAERNQQRLEEAVSQSYIELTGESGSDPYLLVAIVLMIVAMVMLYVSLSWFNPAFAAKLIRRRVLIELLSMGFLLLTVIILGTSRMLDGPALAALLGTMAGYIFGRKPRKKVENTGDPKKEEDTTPAAPGDPAPAAPAAD